MTDEQETNHAFAQSRLSVGLGTKKENDMDERLEEVSEKIRMGIPVGMSEAIEAIEYQQKLRAEKDDQRGKTLAGRFMRWIRGA